jgi:hypothetical protein
VRSLGAALIGVVLAGAAAVGWQAWQRREDPCLGRCGVGTRCEAGSCRPVEAAAPAPAAAPKKRGRRSRGEGGAPQPQLQPGDTVVRSEGEKLGTPGTRLDLTKEDDGPSQLEQGDLDAVFDAKRESISQCVVEAVGDYPLERARVEVGFRVEPGGSVSRVRIQAPELLLRNHVSSCIRPIVTALRFPRAGGATVATYPFELK